MNPSSLEKVGSRVRAWKRCFSDVGAACGRIQALVPRYDAIQAALTEATTDEQIKAQFAAMAQTLNEAERLFRELEHVAGTSKVASRDAAAQLKKLSK
jgi:hypothetical protein